MSKTTSRRLGLAAIVVATLVLALAYPVGMRLRQTSTAFADAGAAHQTMSNNYGVSGGNVNDISSAFCCSGTLGSLVTDDTTDGFFILSNNHVLARSGAASSGEKISQPGLVDTQCQAKSIVAELTSFPPLSSNVDAAIAKLTPESTMNKTGEIQDIGTISSTP